jgi:putative endopeptidase
MKKTILYCFVLLLFFSCKTKTTENKPDVFAANVDSSYNPGDDFFLYANGKWIKNNPIPPEESSWGIGYLVNNENEQRIHDICEEAAKENAAKGSASQKIGDFWTAAMDSAAIEKQGTKYLQPYFDQINAINDIPSFINVVADFDKIGEGALFRSGVDQDDKESNVMSFKLYQGGLGLPERDYYFNKDSSTTNIRKAYVQHVAKILEFQGKDSATASKSAENIMALEMKLAKVSRTLADLRDPYANYHKMAITDLKKLSSSIDWEKFLKDIGVTKIDSVIVGQPEFFKSLDATLKSTSINDLKDYLTYRLVNSFSNALPEKYDWKHFNTVNYLVELKKENQDGKESFSRNRARWASCSDSFM